MTNIIPQYKLIMTYNIDPRYQSEYSQFVIGTFVPSAQTINLYILQVYHTLYGDYPSRQAELGAESLEIMRTALDSKRFQDLETALMKYISDYQRKLVVYRKGFQF